LRALVVGGNGFIGSHLVDYLLYKDYVVRVFDHAPERYRASLPGVEYIQGEFLDVKGFEVALEGVDVMFHLVGTTLPATSNRDILFDLESNLVTSVKLFDACVKHHVKRVVFVSSGGTVYGIPSRLPVEEAHPTNPICAYGVSKLTIEKYLNLFSHLYGLEFSIARPSNPYGERQSPLGEQGVIPVFIGKILKGEPIEVWGDGSVVRDYFYVGDLVEALELLGSSPEAKNRIFNIGSGQGISLIELVKAIKGIADIDIQINYLPGRKFDVPSIYLDIKSIEKNLGWHPQISLEQGLKITWEWVQQVIKVPVPRS